MRTASFFSLDFTVSINLENVKFSLTTKAKIKIIFYARIRKKGDFFAMTKSYAVQCVSLCAFSLSRSDMLQHSENISTAIFSVTTTGSCRNLSKKLQGWLLLTKVMVFAQYISWLNTSISDSNFTRRVSNLILSKVCL